MTLAASLVRMFCKVRFCAYCTVSPLILIRHTEFHMQPTSAGPGTRAHDTHGMQKSAQHILVWTQMRRMGTSCV
jgi:hypothetical protein